MFIRLNTGKILEHYDYGEIIGEGAFGMVKKVRKKKTKEERAMKII